MDLLKKLQRGGFSTRQAQALQEDRHESQLAHNRKQGLYMFDRTKTMTLPYGAGHSTGNLAIPDGKWQIFKGDDVELAPGTARDLDIVNVAGAPGYPMGDEDAFYDVYTSLFLQCAAADDNKVLEMSVFGAFTYPRVFARVHSYDHRAHFNVCWWDQVTADAVGDQNWCSIVVDLDLSALTVAPTIAYFAHYIVQR